MMIKRRQKEMIDKNISNYLERTTTDYSQYFEGSPTYITYYQYNFSESSQDGNLETVHSLLGDNSPNKYKKIFDVVVYGVDALDISTQLSERGLQNLTSGEIVFLPDSIRPRSGDFFVFDYEGLESHLFIIEDVQFDKLSPTKYYRASFSLYQHNSDDIFNNVEDEYSLDISMIGGEETPVIQKDSKILKDTLKDEVDNLIDKYSTFFYDSEMDCFSMSKGGSYFWSPYLQHFIYNTNAMETYADNFMNEIFIMDINEEENDKVYNEHVYRNSLFFLVEKKMKRVSFSNFFFKVQLYDLKSTRNLPYFNSSKDYKLITPMAKMEDGVTDELYNNAFNIIFGSPDVTFNEVDHYHKVHIADIAHVSRIEEFLNPGDFLYECNLNEMIPNKMFKVLDDHGDLELIDISADYLFKNNVTYLSKELYLFNIIKEYINGSLKLTRELIDNISNLELNNNVYYYIFIPMILKILKSL